jgi:cell division septation protein DedD
VKERLTGAIILVALIVLLVPELLTGPVRSSPRVAAASSSAEEPPLRSYTINLADDAPPRTTTLASGPEQPTPVPASAPAATTPAPAPPAAQAPPVSAPPPVVARAPAAAAKPAATRVAAVKAAAPPADGAGSGAWLVQLGSFASRANAERLAQQVRDGGFKVNVSQASSGRHLYRVLVGPSHDRAAATQLAAKLQAAGHRGAVVSK